MHNATVGKNGAPMALNVLDFVVGTMKLVL